MRSFVVCGSREVAGRKPGSVLSEVELGEANIEALIQAGLISVQVSSVKATKVADVSEEEQE